MDHTVCCHQVTVWHIHRVDMDRAVYLVKPNTIKRYLNTNLRIFKSFKKNAVWELGIPFINVTNILQLSNMQNWGKSHFELSLKSFSARGLNFKH